MSKQTHLKTIYNDQRLLIHHPAQHPQVEPPPPPSKLLILGARKFRLTVEVRVLNRIDGKLPGHVASLQKSSIEGNNGLTVMELKPGW